MASLAYNDAPAGGRGRPLPYVDLGYQPSEMQMAFYRWLWEGQGNANVIAVAGSGKSTSIRGGLCYIPEEASVTILAFNAKIASEMREKVEGMKTELAERGIFRNFQKVEAKTFHGLGWSSILRHLGLKGRDPRVELTGGKSRKILREKLDKAQYKMYGSFVSRLVSLAKGMGLGWGPNALGEATRETLLGLVHHHDLSLESEHAQLEEALKLSLRLLDYSTKVAEKRFLFDFDDQIYLPLIWGLSVWRTDFVFIDEAQDTNPARRALAVKALKPGGRLVAVGDPNQAIYGFTGASHDAMDLIKKEFGCVDLPLTVSYRCPKAAEALVRTMVPHFKVADTAPEGAVLRLSVQEGLARLGPRDAVICRNSAPLIDLAFSLIAEGRPCVILGRDIGAQLVELIEKMDAVSLDDLQEKLIGYRNREVAELVKRDEEEKAAAVEDRVQGILTMIGGLKETQRSITSLIKRIEEMFSDDDRGVLTLGTGHKMKGLEFPRVGFLEPGLIPSKWARQDHQVQQERNLEYVIKTRFQEEFIYLDGMPGGNPDLPKLGEVGDAWDTFFEKKRQESNLGAEQEDDLAVPAFLKRSKE